MKLKLKINVHSFLFNLVILLLWIKLLFSYLSVKLTYFQKGLTPNVESFNPLGLPENFSNNIELILLPVLFYIIIKYYKYYGRLKELIVVSFLMFFLNILTSLVNGKPLLDSLNYSFKLFLPFYLFCFLVASKQWFGKDIKKTLIKTIKLCAILSIFALLFFNPSYNRLQDYLPIFFSGIHTHNYVLVYLFIAISFFLYRKQSYIALLIFLILSIAFLYYGYNVRTPIMVYLIYCLALVYLISDIFKVLIIKISVFLPLAVFFFFLITDINELSSGRLDMYSEKIKQLSEYNVIDWAFGKGSGSDLIYTDVWWWDKKGAHSDLLTFIVENGILYFILFLYFFVKLLIYNNKLNLIYISILLGCLFSSTISNGVFTRPIAGYIFFMLLAYIYININNNKTTIHQ